MFCNNSAPTGIWTLVYLHRAYWVKPENNRGLVLIRHLTLLNPLDELVSALLTPSKGLGPKGLEMCQRNFKTIINSNKKNGRKLAY